MLLSFVSLLNAIEVSTETDVFILTCTLPVYYFQKFIIVHWSMLELVFEQDLHHYIYVIEIIEWRYHLYFRITLVD